jgi:hypothetical protein
MEVIRQYKNASDEDLRVDQIRMVRRSNTISKDKAGHTFRRELKVTWFHGPVDRDIAVIEVVGDYTSIETATGDFKWTRWTSPPGICDMSDLPEIGDTI